MRRRGEGSGGGAGYLLAMQTKTTLALLLGLTGCQLSVPLPQGEVDNLAQEIAKIGHPGGTYVGSSVVNMSSGLLNDARSVDVAIRYQPALSKKEQTLTVRLYVESVSPCSVRSEVLSDTGPKPILLDNQLAAPHVGRMVCDLFRTEGDAKAP